MSTVSTNRSTSGRLKSGQGNMHFKTHEEKLYNSGKMHPCSICKGIFILKSNLWGEKKKLL